MTPLPWSHSALEKFSTCPKQYHEVKVIKRIEEPMGEAAAYGNTVHKLMEDALNGTASLPPTHAYLQEYVDAILRRPGVMFVEKQMALNQQLEPVDFFCVDVWVRGKADVITVAGDTAHGVDWKTGKRKATKQMMLMALLIFYHFPEVEHVRTGFCWLKTSEMDKEEFLRREIPALWDLFIPELQQYQQAFATDTWQPRQNGLCAGWCPVTDCEYWRPKRVRTRP
jgi:hypothetical protein